MSQLCWVVYFWPHRAGAVVTQPVCQASHCDSYSHIFLDNEKLSAYRQERTLLAAPIVVFHATLLKFFVRMQPKKSRARKRKLRATDKGPSTHRSRRQSTRNSTLVSQASVAVAAATEPSIQPNVQLNVHLSVQPNVHSSPLDNLQRLYQPSPRQRDQTQPLTICFVAEPREKLCQSAPQLPAGSASTLVEGAIAVAHSRIAGAPQLLPTNISITQCSDPSQVFLLAGLLIDSQISAKIKEKIWNEEFVDFGSLLSNPGQDKYQISVQNSTAGNPASFCPEPVAQPT